MAGYEDLNEQEKDKADNYQDVYNSKSQIDKNIKIPVNLNVVQLNTNI